MEHTPEPWYTGNSPPQIIYWGLIAILSDSDKVYIWQNTHTVQDHEANARRIVACVNACKGISTQELETDGILPQVQRAIDVAYQASLKVGTDLDRN